MLEINYKGREECKGDVEHWEQMMCLVWSFFSHVVVLKLTLKIQLAERFPQLL